MTNFIESCPLCLLIMRNLKKKKKITRRQVLKNDQISLFFLPQNVVDTFTIHNVWIVDILTTVNVWIVDILQ